MMAFLASLAVIDGELRADGYTMHLGSLPSWISAATAIIAVGMIFVRIGKRDQQIDSLAESNKQLASAISGLILGIADIRAIPGIARSAQSDVNRVCGRQNCVIPLSTEHT